MPMVPVSQGQREREIETGDGQMNRTRERGSLGRLFRVNRIRVLVYSSLYRTEQPISEMKCEHARRVNT